MFKVGDKAYFNKETLQMVREGTWEKNHEYWEPYGLTEEMVGEIMACDYTIVKEIREQGDNDFQAIGFTWANRWFEKPEPKGLEGATKLV